MIDPVRTTPDTPKTRRPAAWLAAGFALGTLVFGMLSAGLGFALNRTETPTPPLHYPQFYPPQWVFWVVWLIIYPCWGIATYLVWERRRESDIHGALILYIQSMIGAGLFVPIMNLVAGNPAVLTLLDANGLIGSYLLAWLYARTSRASVYWLIPLLLWMPMTFVIKIALWLANRG